MEIQANRLNTPAYKAKSPIVKQNLQTGEISNTPSFGLKPLDETGWVAKKITLLDDGFNSAWQRLVAGVTGLFLQPGFDWNNKRVDESTRKISTARTIAKIVVGTATGVGIRALCILGANNFTKNNATEAELAKKAQAKGKTYKPKTIFKNWEQCLLSKEAIEKGTYREIKKYRGAIGTFVALMVMFFTNFLIDAPLTTYLTNKIKPILTKKQTKHNTLEGGNS